LKILIAEDDAVSRHKLKAFLLKCGDEVVVAKDGLEAGLLLQQEDCPKLAILDWEMPGADGVEVCRQVRQKAAEPYIYILMLTAKDRTEDVIAALEAGADDYLSKPLVPAVLKARLLTGRRIVDLQEQLIKAREKLRVEATHDFLTGLWNRPAILEAFQREIGRAAREGGSLAVAVADIDHFKSINDTYGHSAGDAVLCEVTKAMQSSIRSYDMIGRFGGEEFLIVFPRCESANAMKLAERVRQNVAAQSTRIAGKSISVTVSLGVAVFHGAEDAPGLIPGADAALYQAKHLGRNRVELFTRAGT
jgi:diguanylate cyclase (GGDEF)-like protein